ncbi:MAG: hypothetical protein U0992_17535 [Planctomycetaceae bacterium]
MLRRVVAALLCVAAAAGTCAAEDMVKLKVRNNLQFERGGKRATVWVKSTKSLTPQSPWRRLDINPGRTTTLDLASPDDFIVRAEAGGITYESDPIPLRAWLKENPNFELTLDAVAAAPADNQMQMRYKFDYAMGFSAPDSDPGIERWKRIPFKEVPSANKRGRRR